MSHQDKQSRPQGSQQGGNEAGRRQAQGGYGASNERSAAGSNYGDWSGSRGMRDDSARGGYGLQEQDRGERGDHPGRSEDHYYHGGSQERQGRDEQGNFGRQDYGNGGRFGGGDSPYGMRDMGPMPRQGGERGQSGQQDEFDPDYIRWRDQQMRSLDEDYRSWRQDRYKKFSDEFSTWRGQRSSAAASGPGESSGAEEPETAGSRGGSGSSASTSGKASK